MIIFSYMLYLIMSKGLLEDYLTLSIRTYTHMLATGSLEEETPTLQIGAKTQTCPLLLVQSPRHHSAAALWVFLCLLVDLCSEESPLVLLFLAGLTCPSACCYHFLQIHSYLMCWLTSSHHEAAVTIQIVHRSRHFAMERDSLQSSNLFWGHIFVWLSLETPLS